jgi:hypothetical protein
MQQTTSPSRPTAPEARHKARAPSRSKLPRTLTRRRHLEAHAVAWLRSLRDGKDGHASTADVERAP